MKTIIVFEESSRVEFGGGQKMTLITCDILKATYDCSFRIVDFSDQTRFDKIAREKYPECSFVNIAHASATSDFRMVSWIKAIWQMLLFFKRDVRKTVDGLRLEDTISYVTNKRSLPYAYYLRKKYGIPFVYHAHLAENPRSFYFPIFRRWIRKAEIILCVSNLVKETIGLDQCKLLYNPTLNTKGYKGKKTDGHFVVAYVGGLIPIKGVEYFVGAAKKCPDRIEFRAYGEGPLRMKLEKLAEGRVIFKGFFKTIIDEYYHDVDIIVLPTILKEALPLVVVDAKSVGLPVVVTKPGGQAEIVREGIDGYLVSMKSSEEIANAIMKIAENLELYNNLSKASFDSSSIFSYELYKEKIVNTFCELL